MCGRFLFTYDDDIDEMRELTDKIIKKYGKEVEVELKNGEVFPSEKAVILRNDEMEATPDFALWGFKNFKNKGVIINARAETVLEKPMFKDSIIRRRCIIPSTGFFEWNQTGKKHKYLFRLPEEDMVYLAGFYNEVAGERRFIILTTDANESMVEIHHRMPVIIPKNEWNNWLDCSDTNAFKDYLYGKQPLLRREMVG